MDSVFEKSADHEESAAAKSGLVTTRATVVTTGRRSSAFNKTTTGMILGFMIAVGIFVLCNVVQGRSQHAIQPVCRPFDLIIDLIQSTP
jgi:hypothetical protein